MNFEKPGDLLLNKYFPNADEETRERARDAFRDFAQFLFRMGERLIADERAELDSTELHEGAKISEAPREPTP